MMRLDGQTAWTWQGERDRPLSLRKPCICGCSQPPTPDEVAYLTASDHEGAGFTIWLDLGVAAAVERVLGLAP